jgi:hypothetical protein
VAAVHPSSYPHPHQHRLLLLHRGGVVAAAGLLLLLLAALSVGKPGGCDLV